MGILTGDEIARYDRQIRIAGWGEDGQEKIRSSSVFIAGAGGLGSPVAVYLAVAGLGEIRICDSDVVEPSNLNRQILHGDARVGVAKVESAAMTLNDLNPAVDVVQFRVHLDQENAEQVIGRPDLILDCLDNYEARYVLNSYSVETGIPLVYGAIWGLEGRVTFLHPPETGCLRCMVREPPPTGTFPVVGATPGITGCIQAMEALKHLTGVGSTLKDTLLVFDGEDMTFRRLKLKRWAECPDCGGLHAGPA